MKPASTRWANKPAAIALPLILALLPTSAHAHLGIATNDLYGGMLHPLLHLASLLPMLALALWLSCCDQSALWRLIPTYLVAAVIGALAGWAQPQLLDAEPLLIGLAAIIGIATTVYRRLPLWSSLPVAALTGLLVGYDNVAKVSAELANPLLFIVGMTLVVGLLVLHITTLLYGRQQLWVRTGARVVGSWITAVALLMMALQFSGLDLKQTRQTSARSMPAATSVRPDCSGLMIPDTSIGSMSTQRGIHDKTKFHSRIQERGRQAGGRRWLQPEQSVCGHGRRSDGDAALGATAQAGARRRDTTGCRTDTAAAAYSGLGSPCS